MECGTSHTLHLRLLVFTAAIATAIAVTQRPRHAADATGDPSSAVNVTNTYLLEANNDQNLETSQHQTVDERHDHSATNRRKHVPVREAEGNSNQYTPRKTVRHTGNTKKRNVSHQRQRLLRKGKTRYIRPMRRKPTLTSTTDSMGHANNSQIHTSSSRFVTSYQNTHNFLAENRSISNYSLVENGRNSTQQERKSISSESQKDKEEALQKGEAISSQESVTRDVSGHIANYKSPGSESVFQNRVSHYVRNPSSRLPAFTKDNQNQDPTVGVSKETEEQDHENHYPVSTRNALSEQNKNIISNSSAYNSYIDHVSDKQHDEVPAVTANNHRGTGWDLHQEDTGDIGLLNETDHSDPPSELQRKRASYSLTAAPNLHTGARVNRKVNNALSQPAPPEKRQDTGNYRLEEGNHVEGTVKSKDQPDDSQNHLLQKIGKQSMSTANPLEAKNQEAAQRNITTHKLRHERRRKVLGHQQSNNSRHMKLTFENTNHSQSSNISHPTYNVYNFYGPVIITNGALLPLNSNGSSFSKESGALNDFSNVLSSQALNVTRFLNYSSSAYNGMSMVFLPTRLVSRLLLQNDNRQNVGSVLESERIHSSNMNSDGRVHNVPFNEPPISSHYDNPSLHTGVSSGPSPGWGGGTHQRPTAFSTGVDEYNRDTGYTGNDHSFSGANTVGFSNMGSGNGPVNVGGGHPDNDMLHSGEGPPPYNAPTGQESHIPGEDNPGAQFSNISGAGIDPNGKHTGITGTAHDSFADTTPLPGGRDHDAQGLSLGQSSDTLNIVLNGSNGTVSSTGNTVDYGSSATGYDNSIVGANSNQGMVSSNYGGTTSDNFLPDAPMIPTGVGASDAGNSPNQGPHFGSAPADPSYAGPVTQQETGWKVRGRIGFEWNPTNTGSTDSGSFSAPPENARNGPWRDYGPFYGPSTGAQTHGWQVPPFPYWRYNNAYPPFRNQEYGSHWGSPNPPWDYMPPPYTENWTPGRRTGYMWLEGDIWKDHSQGPPVYPSPQDLQPTTYSGPGASYPTPDTVVSYAEYVPSIPRTGLPLSHSAASLVGGVPPGAARRAPSGHYSSRRPAHSNQYYRPRPGGSYNPNLLNTLG